MLRTAQPGRITVAGVIDGTGRQPILNATITVRDGRIAAVPADDGGRDEPADGVDRYPGGRLLPGFIDVHAHLSLSADGRSYEAMATDTDRTMVAHGLENARRHLAAGVTTLRDNGGRNRVPFEIRERIAAGKPGPRLLVAGRPVTPNDGHFAWCNGSADTPDEVAAAIGGLVAEGADHIKIMASGGGTAGTDPGRATYSASELRNAQDAAHGLGRQIVAHCRARDSVARAIEARVDGMEHGEFLTPSGGGRGFDGEIAQRLVESGIVLSPTLQAYGWDTVRRLEARSGDGALSHDDADLLAAARRDLDERLDDVSRLLQLGMGPRIVHGSDAGPFEVKFGRPGAGIRLLMSAGLSAMDALLAATSRAAAACGISDVVGTIAPGKLADLVVIDGNPLLDPSALDRVLAVYQGGRRVSTGSAS